MKEKLDKQQKFMVLRAEGKSFDEIAKRINVSKPTLIKWSKEFKEKVAELTKIYEEQFIAEQKIKRTLRAQIVSNELDAAYDELRKTDYKNLSKKDLISMIEKLELKLEKVTGFGREISQSTKNIIIEEYEEGKEKIVPPKLGVPSI